MLMMMLIIAFTATALEMIIVYNLPQIRPVIKRYKILGIVFSFFLAVGLSTVFGSSGTIVAGAAVLSTLMSSVIYTLRLIELCEAASAAIKNTCASVASAFQKVRNAYHQTKRGWTKVRHPISSRKASL